MRPSWAQRLPWNLITEQARTLSMEPCLIAAVIQKESSGITWKTRYEPKYRWLNHPAAFAKKLGVTVDTEIQGQMHSHGLMQIMGATARDMGFLGYFPELCAKPELGIFFGAKYLKQRLVATGTVEKALATYNAGPGELLDGRIDNREYVDSVTSLYRELAGSR